jgi:hypothetical protein
MSMSIAPGGWTKLVDASLPSNGNRGVGSMTIRYNLAWDGGTTAARGMETLVRTSRSTPRFATFRKEMAMGGIGKFKLSDALRPQDRPEKKKGGKIGQASKQAATQSQESHESDAAKDAESSNRGRMVRIGRGNQQAGRQGQ